MNSPALEVLIEKSLDMIGMPQQPHIGKCTASYFRSVYVLTSHLPPLRSVHGFPRAGQPHLAHLHVGTGTRCTVANRGAGGR